MVTEIELQTGTLLIESEDELGNLCGFASRKNAKRGFLFLSKVLGKHYPSCPDEMREVHETLANKIRPILKEGPTVVIGFCETATSLGYGVYESLDLKDSYYHHSTRHKIDHPIFLTFSESHSHATDHYLYLPKNLTHQSILNNPANIIFVDDEYTTGNTLLNTIAAFKEKGIVSNFIATGILDWTDKSKHNLLPELVSLVKGNFIFSSNNYTPFFQHVSECNFSLVHEDLCTPYGRVGCEKLAIDFKSLISSLPKKDERVLVIGTGEFMNVSYLLAGFLKSYSSAVFVQSTTRSPIMLGNDVQSLLEFKDNYGEQVDNFLYNVKDQVYDYVYVCYETGNLPAEHTLYQQLNQLFPNVILLNFK